MSSATRKHLEKIYNKIDAIAKKGKDNVFEYYKYIDELINKGQYGEFEQSMFYYYGIDILQYLGVDEVKKNTWKDILFQTNTQFATKVKKMYDARNVYQMASNMYTTSGTSSSVLIGQITEVYEYSEDSKYLIQNKEFAKLMDSRKVFLDVLKTGSLTASRIDTDNPSLSYDQNLLNRYYEAVTILLS